MAFWRPRYPNKRFLKITTYASCLCEERLNGAGKLGSVADDGDLIAGPQNQLGGREHERVVPPDQDDTYALREIDVAEWIAVGPGVCSNGDTFDGAAACLQILLEADQGDEKDVIIP